jgi:DNA-binding beta-propeller fold protein YncE/glucose/arabinose dehydrogenase
VSVPILILIVLVLPTSSIMPLAYSQESSHIANWNQSGEGVPRLSWPSGIAIDPSSGNVYLADTANQRITIYSSNGTFLTEFGRYGDEDGSFNSPEGVAVDQEGNVYVADTANHRIQVFSSNGTFLTEWGEYGEDNATFRSPTGIALDREEGNVYVADTENNRIQVFSSNGTFLTEWGEYGDEDGSFNSPEGVAVDQEGNVYVADTENNRIQVFSSNGTFLTEWGEYGDEDGSFRFPEGVAVDQEGNVYVADTENNRIQVFSNGTFLTEWGSYGRGEEEIEMRFPEGVAVDQEQNIYVTDTANNRISVIFSSSNNSSPISNISFSSEEGDIYGNDTRIRIEPVYEGLTFPTAIGFLGPNDMLVLERQNNTIMRIVNGQMLDEPVLDLGNNTKIGSCVCDVALLQNDNNGTSYAFVYYAEANVTEDDGKTKLVDALYRYDIINGKLINPKLIFEMPTVSSALHNGGKLTIGPDKNVYLTTGEIDSWRTKAQNIKNGSLPDGSSAVLRFTPDGEPVDGGLFGNTPPLDKYYAYGIRNSFGMDYDPATGNIWITDNGGSYGDELNLVRPGFNGGWRQIMGFSSLDESFNLTNLEFFNGTGKYYDPIFEWLEPVGVTDLVFLPSDKLGKEYEGNLFVGEINSGYLYRFLLNQTRTGLLLDGSLSDGIADTNLEKLEAAFAKINDGGITDLEVGPDGLIYIVSSNGKIMRLETMDTNA